MSPFDKLPAELHDEIFSHVVKPIGERRKGPNNRLRITQGIHVFDYIRNVYCKDFGSDFYPAPRWLKPREMKLRLVSKAFDRAMTRAYFKEEFAVLKAYDAQKLGMVREFVTGKESKFAPFIRRVRIELGPKQGYKAGSVFENLHSEHYRYREELDEASATLGENLGETLGAVCARIPRLEELVVNLDEKWRAEGPVYEEEEFSESTEAYRNLDLELLERVRNSIAGIFDEKGIGNGLEYLSCLRLTLPCTYDFAIIGANISNAMAASLKHLYLEYIDGTGPGGDLYYTRSWQGDNDSEGDEEYPYSNLQKKFPNVEYMDDVFKLVNRCHNLESLGLAGTQPLDFNSLNWKPTNRCLQNLYINRTKMTTDAVLSLLAPSGSDSSIRTLQMEEIQLLDGTWDVIFSRLLRCLLLKYIHVYQLHYAKHGASADHAEHNHRPWEDRSTIWTQREEDKKKLRDLVRLVQERDGKTSVGLKEYADEQDEYDDEGGSERSG